ncbi:MAG: methyltransferase domain-containing protein [Spirochaetales bacterium]|nr:methyltransferase domain-containing protein [Spirochaetales bacterium]
MIDSGEFILLFHSSQTKFLIEYKPNIEFNCHKGQVILPTNLEFGQKLISNKGYVFYILPPTLKDRAMKVKRSHTIVYPKEAPRIIYELGILPGKKVAEIGTGSGAFTMILAETVGKEGKVVSIDISELSHKTAKANISRLGSKGLLENIEFILCETVDDLHNLENQNIPFTNYFDAVFVDIPTPWEVVPLVNKILKKGYRSGFLSPTVEQVAKTYEALEQNNFINLDCFEILERNMKIKTGQSRPVDRMIAHTAYIYFASSSI